MSFISYKYEAITMPGETFSKLDLKNINLFVGPSGSGKTRLLNTIFNLGSFIATGDNPRRGHWEIEIAQDNQQYYFEIQGVEKDGEREITKEIIRRKRKDGTDETLLTRNKERFVFRDSELPKLPMDKPSIYLLKEEKEIKPIHQAFCRIMRRSFSDDTLSVAKAQIYLSAQSIKRFGRTKSLDDLFTMSLSLSAKLYLLKVHFPKKYNLIMDYYKSIFPYVQNFKIDNVAGTDLKTQGGVLLLYIKQKTVSKWLEISQLSSGMVKVLLILTDVISFPGEVLYLIDEYENSLGVNAIDFLPPFLSEYGNNNQFIITTHHPYLINNIPVKNWYLFHRKGENVLVKPGEEFGERFAKSKQRAFIQLINDPFYLEGSN